MCPMYFMDGPLKWLCAHSARVLELGSQSSSLWYHAWEPSIGIFIGSQFHCHFVCVQAAIFVHGGLMLLYFICCKYLADNDKSVTMCLGIPSNFQANVLVKKETIYWLMGYFQACQHFRGKQTSSNQKYDMIFLRPIIVNRIRLINHVDFAFWL